LKNFEFKPMWSSSRTTTPQGGIQTISIKNENDFIYASCNLLNPITSTIAIEAAYVDNRGQAIIQDPANWRMAIIRFDIPSDQITICYWTNDLYVTIIMGSNAYSAQVPWIQTNFILNDNGIYDYSSFAQSINTALVSAFTAAKAGNPGFTGYCPYLEYDPSSSRFSITADINWEDNNINNPLLWFSWPLYSKMPMIYSQQTGYNNADYLDDLIIFHFNGNNMSNISMLPFLNNPSVTVTPTIGFLTMEQQALTLGAMTDLKSLFFTTSSMPVKHQLQPPPIPGATNNFQLKVITDFSPPMNNSIDQSPQSALLYQYNASVYRWIEMTGGTAMEIIDWQIFWRGQNYNPKPLYISPGKSASCLIMFAKKPVIDINPIGSK